MLLMGIPEKKNNFSQIYIFNNILNLFVTDGRTDWLQNSCKNYDQNYFKSTITQDTNIHKKMVNYIDILIWIKMTDLKFCKL